MNKQRPITNLIRVSSLQWGVGWLCSFIGAILLVSPDEFDFVQVHFVSSTIFLWGLLFLLAGFGMFSIVVFSLSRPVAVAAHLFAGLLLVLLAILFGQGAAYVALLTYLILGLGTMVGGLLPGPSAPTTPPPEIDLLAWIMGLSQVVTGMVLLTPIFDVYSPFYTLDMVDERAFGVAFLLTGLLLLFVHTLPLLRLAPARNLFGRGRVFSVALLWTAHILAAISLFVFLFYTVGVDRIWIPTAYYGGLGLFILVLPWLGKRLQRTNPAVLNTRLAVIFSVAAALPLILTTAMVGRLQERSMRADAQTRQNRQAMVIAQTVAEALSSNRIAVEALAAYPHLMDLTWDEKRHLLEVYHENYPDVLAFALFDSDGNPVVRSDETQSQLSVKGYPVFEQARKTGRSTIVVLVSPIYNEPVFAFGAPVFDAQGRFAGLVVSSTRASTMAAYLNRLSRLQVNERVFVVDSQGHALAHPDPERMATMADLSENPAVQAIRSGKQNGSLVYTDVGSELVAGFARVPDSDWGVVVERPVSDAIAGLDIGRSLIFGILLFSILITTMAGIVLATRVTQPLSTLSSAVSRFSEGNTQTPLPTTPIIEIQHLTDVFDDMRQRLASRTAEREKAQRELARSNLELQATVNALQAAEEDLRAAKQELEERVRNRTLQLHQANESLESINARLSEVNLQLEYELAERERAEQQREAYLQRLNTLINSSKQVLAESTLPGLLQGITDSARELVGANLCVSGYGGDGDFQVVSVSQDPQVPPQAGEGLLQKAHQSSFMDLLEKASSVRLAASELPEGFPAQPSGLLACRLPVAGDMPKGIILVSGSRGGEFSGLDQSLLEHLASLASLGMQHINARQEAERRAQELNTVVDSMLEAVMIYDHEGSVVRANPAAAEIYSHDLVPYTGNLEGRRPVACRMDGSPYKTEELPVSRALRGETVRNELMRFQSDNGGPNLVLETTASPVYTQGRLFGAVVVSHDVGERERLMEVNRRQAELLRSIFEVDPSGMAVLGGENLEFRLVNPSYREMTPHPEVDPLGRRFNEIWPAEEGFRGSWLLDRVRETGKPFHLSPYIQTFPDGSVRYYSFHAQQLLWEGEMAVLMVLWDTTRVEEAHSRAELAAAEARRRAAEAEEGHSILEALLENTPQGIAIAAAPDITLQRVSRYGMDLTGWLQPEILGLSLVENPGLWQAVHLDGKTPADTRELPLSRAIFSGEVVRNEEWLLKLDSGELLPILCNAGPIRDVQGNIVGGVMVWTDIAARKRAEESVKAYARQLEVTNRELQDFTFIASHDLQEPLRKIQAFGNRLNSAYRHSLDKEGLDYLDRMTSASSRMQSMLNDLLAYSRVTTKAKPFVHVDLNQIARQSISDLEMRIDATGGEVVVEDLPTIEADQLQIGLLFQNLIGNALKFHKVGETPLVKVSARILPPDPDNTAAPAGWCELAFEDNGIGFEMEFVDRIFQPFQRLHGRSEYEGSGIGLAICRKIADRHGGSITAQSALGQGSTFFVRLPLRQPKPKKQALLPAPTGPDEGWG